MQDIVFDDSIFQKKSYSFLLRVGPRHIELDSSKAIDEEEPIERRSLPNLISFLNILLSQRCDMSKFLVLAK